MLLLCDLSYGQAVWGGKEYYKPVCSNPNCPMCNSIRNQLYAQAQQVTPVISEQPAVSVVTKTTQQASPTVQQYRTEYRTEYKTESKRVKRCNGRTCWYETVTEQVPVQVAVQVPIPMSAPVIAKSVVENVTKNKSLDKVDVLVPTPKDAVDIAIELLALTPNDVLCEPGCGDGRILSKSTCPSIGVELNPETAKLAKSSAPKALIVTGDAAEYDYTNVTVVYMYLYPDLMNKIVPLLKPGTRIVSYCHTVPGVEWEEHVIKKHTFYTATVQGKVETKADPMLIVNPVVTIESTTMATGNLVLKF